MLKPPILLFSALIVPFKDSIISLQMDKPKPLILLDSSVVYNGSKIFFNSLEPVPLSEIVNFILLFSSVISIFITFLFLSKYLILLLIILENTLLNLDKSTYI